MYLLLCLLLVSSFSVMGLLGLWAGTSRRHWFVRTAVVAIVLCPLLLVPAYEPFVAFVVEAFVVATGFVLVRQFRSSEAQRQSEETDNRKAALQYSLTSLLCLMVVVGIAAAIAVRLPQLSWIAWLNTVHIGAATGVAALLGAWLAFGRMRWWGRVPMALAACMLAALPLARTDYFLDSFASGGEPWPPPGPGAVPAYGAALNWLWLALSPGISLATALWLAFALVTRGNDSKRHIGTPHSSLRMAATGVWTVLLAILPAHLLYRMLNPTPIPIRAYPSPNGYEQLVMASRMIQSPILDDYDAAKPTQLASAVSSKAEAYELFRRGLRLPSKVPFDLQDPSPHEQLNASQLRSLARSVMAEGRFAEFEERLADAANVYADNIELGQRTTADGLLIHALVGAAIQNMGNSGLTKIRRMLPPETAGQLVRRLWEIEQRRDPIESLLANDRIWLQHAVGWYGRTQLALADLAREEHYVEGIVRKSYLRAATLSRLLIAELAIQAYVGEHGTPPNRLDALVPKFLRGAVIDPCSGEPLRYLRDGSDWLVYSVWYDGRDDGGRPPAGDDGSWEDGDFSLDAWWNWLDTNGGFWP